MCGRYELIDGQRVFLRFNITTTAPLLRDGVPDNLDVRPSQQVAAVVSDQVLRLMQWGLVPFWAKDATIGHKLINARAEGIAEKPSFKRPLRSQRCILPASAFFEWRAAPGAKAKTKYRIGRRDGELFGLAGLYDTWTSAKSGADAGTTLTTCTIITTTPNAVVAPIHDRMPVILRPEDEADWLNPDLSEPEEIVTYLRPYPDEWLEARVA